MNKSELIEKMATKSGLSKEQAGSALTAFVATINEAMQANDTVSLVGFGTFSVKERKARTGRNPKTGEEMQIPASRVPSFKVGKGLKDSVNTPVEAADNQDDNADKKAKKGGKKA